MKLQNKTTRNFARGNNKLVYSLPRNRSAAMEMSVGTIVTVVLLMTVLIMGLVVVRTIFTSTTDNVKAIDQAVKDQINKLFSEDEDNQVVIIPDSRTVIMNKGDAGGFALGIKNTETGEDKTFSYKVTFNEKSAGCTMTDAEAQALLEFRTDSEGGQNIIIPSGNKLNPPRLIKFSIPKTAQVCSLTYNLDILEGGSNYVPTIDLYVKIK